LKTWGPFHAVAKWPVVLHKHKYPQSLLHKRRLINISCITLGYFWLSRVSFILSSILLEMVWVHDLSTNYNMIICGEAEKPLLCKRLTRSSFKGHILKWILIDSIGIKLWFTENLNNTLLGKEKYNDTIFAWNNFTFWLHSWLHYNQIQIYFIRPCPFSAQIFRLLHISLE
jgi:hypothetical protein